MVDLLDIGLEHDNIWSLDILFLCRDCHVIQVHPCRLYLSSTHLHTSN